jgi:hypothetical protein
MATSDSSGKVLRHTRHGLMMVGDKVSLFDLHEPVWHSDEKSNTCDKCKTKFTFTNRRVMVIILVVTHASFIIASL